MTAQMTKVVRDRNGAIDFKHYDEVARQQRALQWRSGFSYLMAFFRLVKKKGAGRQQSAVMEMQCRDC